jgi:protein-S-isoprenylcysteine O-methyltransferase Ste14
MRYLLLALLWSAWCFVHSALISLRVTAFLKRRLEDRFRFTRLVYNGFASVTLVPVAWYTYSLKTEPLFSWNGSWRAGQVLLLAVSLFLFVEGARHYDGAAFLGIRQLKKGDGCTGLTETCALETRGILGIVRHPWYAGGMMIIWARDLDLSAIITNVILTGYFVVGAFLEERKLSIEFPESYKEYRQKVSMFFPYRWLKSKLRN